jgi:diacylglycerol kinase
MEKFPSNPSAVQTHLGESVPGTPFADSPEPECEPGTARRRRSWRNKFRAAFRGVKLGVRGHSSFSIHIFFTAMVIAAAIVLRCGPLEWCILLGCIGLVMIAELFNSAMETLFRGLDEATRERAWPALDIAAGAVLLASITAAVLGAIVFLRQLGMVIGE